MRRGMMWRRGVSRFGSGCSVRAYWAVSLPGHLPRSHEACAPRRRGGRPRPRRLGRAIACRRRRGARRLGRSGEIWARCTRCRERRHCGAAESTPMLSRWAGEGAVRRVDRPARVDDARRYGPAPCAPPSSPQPRHHQPVMAQGNSRPQRAVDRAGRVGRGDRNGERGGASPASAAAGGAGVGSCQVPHSRRAR